MRLREILNEEQITSQQVKSLFQRVALANVPQLMAAWQKAGSPTDLGQVRKILTGLRVPANVIAQAMQTISVGATPQYQPEPGTIQKTFDPRAAKLAKAAAQKPKGYQPAVPHYDIGL